MTPQEELMNYLIEIEGLLSLTVSLKGRGYAYDSPVDFLRQHGAWYTPHPLPRDMPRGAPKCCYGNALVRAVFSDLRYVEGYALADVGGPRMPFEHAWTVDTIGRVYEVTWPEVGLAYFGVTFSVERADDATWNGDASVLNDYRRRHPLLQQPWTGESEAITWPPSPRLDVLRKAKTVLDQFTASRPGVRSAARSG